MGGRRRRFVESEKVAVQHQAVQHQLVNHQGFEGVKR